jgi:hypothetical protein
LSPLYDATVDETFYVLIYTEIPTYSEQGIRRSIRKISQLKKREAPEPLKEPDLSLLRYYTPK